MQSQVSHLLRLAGCTLSRRFSKGAFKYSRLEDRFNTRGIAKNRADIIVTNQHKRVAAIRDLFQDLLPMLSDSQSPPTKAKLRDTFTELQQNYPKLLRAIINTSIQAEPPASRELTVTTLVKSLEAIVAVLKSPLIAANVSAVKILAVKLDLATAHYPAWFTWEARDLIYKLVVEIADSLALETNDSIAKTKDILLKILPNLCTLAEIERNKRFSLEYSPTDTQSHTFSTITTTDATLSTLAAESPELESIQEIESLRLQLSEIIDGRRLSYISDSPIDDADYVTANDLFDSGLLEESSLPAEISEAQKVTNAANSELSTAVLRVGDLLVRIFDSLERRDLFGVMTTLKLSNTNHKLLMDLIVCRVNTQFDELPLELILQTLHLSSQFFGLNVLSLLYRLRNQYQARLESGQFTTDQFVNTFALVSKHKLINFDGFIFELIERLTNPALLDKLSKFRLPYVAYLLAKSPYAKTKHFMAYVLQHDKNPVGNVKFILRGLAIRGEFLTRSEIQTTLRIIHEGFDLLPDQAPSQSQEPPLETPETHTSAQEPVLSSTSKVKPQTPKSPPTSTTPTTATTNRHTQRTLSTDADRAVLSEVCRLLSSGVWAAADSNAADSDLIGGTGGADGAAVGRIQDDAPHQERGGAENEPTGVATDRHDEKMEEVGRIGGVFGSGQAWRMLLAQLSATAPKEAN